MNKCETEFEVSNQSKIGLECNIKFQICCINECETKCEIESQTGYEAKSVTECVTESQGESQIPYVKMKVQLLCSKKLGVCDESWMTSWG